MRDGGSGPAGGRAGGRRRGRRRTRRRSRRIGGAYATDWGGESAVHSEPIPAYDGAREALGAFVATLDLGDPAAAGRALPEVVDADEPPLRVFLGTQGNEMPPRVHADRLETWAQWQELSVRAQG
ncbi:hypothetical protein ABZ621_33345 [Streptomyces sp. NPDC007863]|uniref:hypothetical protein n=1 Tax=Streptomyces sp. NPDC007863 TaxID=3154894 RepID=UPI0033F885EE